MVFLNILFSNICNLYSSKIRVPQPHKINDFECFEADTMKAVFKENNKPLSNLPSSCFHNEVSVTEEIGVGGNILGLYSGEA
jgi:hypothetical protein